GNVLLRTGNDAIQRHENLLDSIKSYIDRNFYEPIRLDTLATKLTQRMENRLPGLYYIETDDTGERTFYYWRNEAAAKFWLESEQ
ncbi:hypothetical protein MJN51_37595, partial [Salmonella enterica subsp. enterica serovar Kentucky]|nr:hypothetical protein [Salmonella enterica subsp. enterica serovar Kentucky]